MSQQLLDAVMVEALTPLGGNSTQRPRRNAAASLESIIGCQTGELLSINVSRAAGSTAGTPIYPMLH